jgi:acetoin utilization deacetylase AcuC-like enzyme
LNYRAESGTVEAVILFHDPRCMEYGRAGQPERPERISETARLLRKVHPEWEWRIPAAATEAALRRAHSAAHLARIQAAAQDFDTDTPVHPDIFEHAARAAGAAIDVAAAAMSGTRAFALMRPPGHHATADQAMGFCYFSNVAVAALDALARGAERVAIWDFDAHHGNGTEAIVAGHERIAFASIHQFPAYPGTGARSFGNVSNYPIAPLSSRMAHVDAVRKALDGLLAFRPDLLLVSAGFDAFSRDPITQMTLEIEDFAAFGNWLGETEVPTAAILEGGYSDELPALIDAFLTGWKSH